MYLITQNMLITHVSIVHTTPEGFLSPKMVYLAHLYYVILNRKKSNYLTSETSKKREINISNFFDKCLFFSAYLR